MVNLESVALKCLLEGKCNLLELSKDLRDSEIIMKEAMSHYPEAIELASTRLKDILKNGENL